MNDKTRLGIQRVPWRDAVEFYLAQYISPDKVAYGVSVVMESVPQGQAPSGETFTLSEDETQQLFNELWNAGFRPPHYAGSEAIEKQAAHLEDMRRIAFKFIDGIK
jgi:hypothetical protein